MESHAKTIEQFHSHPWAFFRFYFASVVLLFLGFLAAPIFLFFAVLIVLVAEITRHSETFYVMENGVGREYKFLSATRKFVGYDKIQNMEVRQSFLERIFGIGVIKFDTAGMDKVELQFGGIKNPHRIEEIIRSKMIAS